MTQLTCLEICAGAGGQALGLELAGFEPAALIDNDRACCNTLRFNRPKWNVVEGDVKQFQGKSLEGIDLLAGGVPCSPFSKASKQLGRKDERDLFPEAVRLVDECHPRAVLLENVRGFLDISFENYRLNLKSQLQKMGYKVAWKLLNASHFGVSQLRPRVVIVGIQKDLADGFVWPHPNKNTPLTVGQLLYDQMASRGWEGAEEWKLKANDIAPTIVGGSKKHGGPDLGPTRAKRAWAKLGVDGMGIANEPPSEDFDGMPKLTVPMVARIQGFPDTWHFTGKKTPAYRQVGNAFPPPVAHAVASSIYKCLSQKTVFAVSR